MHSGEPIRIISDLHFGHPASFIADTEELAPLCEGVSRLVFNGDTVEMRSAPERALADDHLKEIAAACRGRGTEAVFINGNHDPVASAISHLDLAGHKVLVTHGDLLFHDIAPWSHEAKWIAEAHTRELAQMDEEMLTELEHRLAAGKRAAMAYELLNPHVSQGVVGRLVTVAAQLWPPWKPLIILKVWRDAPMLAAALAEMYRPNAQLVIIGHTHRCGVWQVGSRTVINCGSFLPLSGRMAVDIHGCEVSIRPILRRRDGFHAGNVQTTFRIS